MGNFLIKSKPLLPLPLDIYQCIFDQLNFINKIRFRYLCKTFYKNLHMTDFDLPLRYLYKLSQPILDCHPHIKKLRYDTTYVIYLDKFTKLETLYIHKNAGIFAFQDSDKILKNLTNLSELHLVNNKHITDINHLTKLTRLDISGADTIIKDEGISNLTNLLQLSINYNSIKIINDFTKLTSLQANYNDQINNDNLKSLTDLKLLSIYQNYKITDLNHLINLEILDVGGLFVSITNDSFKQLTSIKVLRVDNNKLVTDIRHLTNLVYLSAEFWSGISEDNIKGLTKLKEIKCDNNLKLRPRPL